MRSKVTVVLLFLKSFRKTFIIGVSIPLAILANPQNTEGLWYAWMLRSHREGWTPALARQYFTFVNAQQPLRGGASYAGHMLDMEAEALRTARTVHVTTHINPDGDGIGAGLALLHGLERLGKRVRFLCPSRIASLYAFLPGFARIETVLDDRGLRPGVMFGDIELIGIPHRVVVSGRGVLNVGVDNAFAPWSRVTP